MLHSVRILAPGKPAAAAVSGTAGTEAGIFSVHCVLPTLIFITTLEWNGVEEQSKASFAFPLEQHKYYVSMCVWML